MNQLTYPNQQQLVEKAFKELLNLGVVTTLDVKNYLRTTYPLLNWTQELVSTCCNSIYENSNNIQFTDNGRWREYFLDEPTTMYTYTTKSGVTISSDKIEQVIYAASSLGENIYYSKSKQTFILVEDMASEHLYNAIRLELDDITEAEEFAFYLNESPLVEELTSRFK